MSWNEERLLHNFIKTQFQTTCCDFLKLTFDKIFAKSYWNSFPISSPGSWSAWRSQFNLILKNDSHFGRQYLLKSQSRLQVHSTWTATTPPGVIIRHQSYTERDFLPEIESCVQFPPAAETMSPEKDWIQRTISVLFIIYL